MNWSHEELHDLQIAGKIARFTLDQLEPYVKPGVAIGALHDTAIKIIIKSYPGADLAFPPNISINECAAHDTAAPNEKRVIPKNSVVKIDIGANINGMLSDTARTFSTDGKNGRLLKASQKALENAIKIIKPGLKISSIGETVQETIEEYGFKPIANLTGHQMEKGQLHAGLSIPSVKGMPFAQRGKLKVGMILAIEPFATNGIRTGAGYVEDGVEPALIFSSSGKPRSDIGKLLTQRFNRVPFSLRSAYHFLKTEKIEIQNLEEILREDQFRGYRPLIEKSGGLVSQAEHTVLVNSNGPKVLT